MLSNSILVPDLSSAEWIEWKPIRERFEAAWHAGARPDLEAYLPAAPRLWQLFDLAAVDLEKRLKAGEPARVEDYLRRFPALGQHDGVVVELANAEFALRREREGVSAEEYTHRFPRLTAGWLRTTTADDGPSAAAAPEELPHIPDYEIFGILGAGGMGVVYEAREIALNRRVALKVILAGPFADRTYRQRFQTEAEAVARLAHPNIIKIHRVGEVAGRPFLALEYCAGGSLAAKLAEGALPPRAAAALIETLARAMHVAHAQGVIHRDLKPANVLLQEDGTPKIADFGLAKQLDVPRDAPTSTGAVLGTASYMAPEQAAGKSREVGPAADTYALGAILYELLTRRPPFQAGQWIDTLRQVTDQEPVPPRQLEPGVPVDLETICLKCLEKDPGRRYATAALLADDLRQFLEGRPVAARRIGPVGRLWRWRRRNPLVAGLAVGLVTLLVVATTSAMIAALQYRAQADAEARARTALEEQQYTKNIAIAERELTLNQDIGLAGTLLAQCPEWLRGWEWHYLMRLRDGARDPLKGHTAGLWAAVYSPDGSRIATASIDGTCKVFDAATGVEVLPPFRGHANKLGKRVPVMCVAFSPSGQLIASGSLAPDLRDFNLADPKVLQKFLAAPNEFINPRKMKGVVHVWDATTGAIRATFDQQQGIVDTLAYSPDGKRIASSSISEEHGVAVWEAQTGQSVGLLRGHTSHVHRLRYSPDGRFIASGSTDGCVKLWDAATLEEVRSLDAHPAPVYDLAFTRDSRQFASASVDGTVRIWDTATGAAVLGPLRGHAGAAMGVAFSPDGRRIATAGYDKTVRLWDATTGAEMITLRGHADMVTSVAFSPDGHRIVSASFDKQVRIWDASPTEPARGPGLFTHGGAAASSSERVNAVAFSRDGALIASGGWDNTVRLWNGQTGAAVRTLTGHTGAIWAVAFSPDGKRVASASWDRTAKVWDSQTGRVLVNFTGHPTPLMGLAFSPDGKRIASCSFEGLVKIWDAATGKETAVCAGHVFPALTVAFDPGGGRLASGSGDRNIMIWDANTGRLLRTLTGHQGAVNCVAYSPDGTHLASASWDQTVRIWDPATGKVVHPLTGHTDRVQGVAFSPDGTRLATASEDKTVRIWDVALGKEVSAPRHQHGMVRSVAFSPDGGRVVAGAWSPTAWLKTWSARQGDR